MKVLRLPGYFPPERFASSYLWENLSDALFEVGISSVVYTPSPTRGISDSERALYRKNQDEIRYDGMMVIHRFRLFKERRHPLQRALRYFIQCIKQYFKGVLSSDALSCDVLFIVSTPPIQGLMASFIKKKRRIPLVYGLQDVFPDSLEGTGLARKGGLIWKIGRRIENKTYRAADKIIVISEGLKRNIVAKGVPEDKIEVVYNWVDTDAIYPVTKSENTLYDEFGISRDLFTIVYAGNLGLAQNVQLILDAANVLHDVQFLIFGTGGLENDVRKEIQSDHLENISLLPLQPYSRVSEVYSLGDACIVSCKAGLGGSVLPSKTWSIMACGRPVIASFDEGELKEILEQNTCGLFCKAGDVSSFVEAISILKSNPALCQVMSECARRFVKENMTKDIGTRKYVDIISSVVK